MSDLHPIFKGILESHFPGVTSMQDAHSTAWQKGTGTIPCLGGDFVDVRYADGEESWMLTAGGLPWSEIAEWRLSEPYGAIKAAYLEGYWHGRGGDERTEKRNADGWNWTNSQSYDDAVQVQIKFGKIKPA